MAPYPSYTSTWHTTTYPGISPSRPELSLAGKSILLTGGGAGIGLAIAKSIVSAGATNLIIVGRRMEVLTAATAELRGLVGSTTNVLPISADVSNPAQVSAAFSIIAAKLPGTKLDVLVSNAGYFNGIRPLGAETADELQTMYDINVKGVYLITTAFLKLATTNAKIINISTAISHLPAAYFPGFASYAATKLAGTKIMEYVQAENPEMSIVDLHPGQVTTTDMAAKADNKGTRIDDPELAADFTVWALSEEATFLKGKFAWVNWDVDELKIDREKIASSALLTIGLEGSSSFK